MGFWYPLSYESDWIGVASPPCLPAGRRTLGKRIMRRKGIEGQRSLLREELGEFYNNFLKRKDSRRTVMTC